MTILDLLAAAALKGSLVIAAAALLVLLLYRQSAALRHAVWSTAMTAVLLLPLLSLWMPSWRVASPEVVRAYRAALPAPASAPAASVPTGPTAELPPATAGRVNPSAAGRFHVPYLLYIWAAGVLTLGIAFVGAAARLACNARRTPAVTELAIVEAAETIAAQLGVDPARVRLRWSPVEITPITWGIWSPVVLLPTACRSWEADRMRQVLVHEIGHIQRWDVLTQAISTAVTVLYWFNPLMWIAAHRMLVERERACDDLVLRHGAVPSAYAHELLEIARGMGSRWAASHVSPAMARRSQISSRLLDVLDPDRRREGVGRRAAIVAALAGSAVLIPLAALAPRVSPETVEQTTAVAMNNPSSADAKAVADANAAFVEALRRRDAKAIADLYTTDSVMVTVNGPPVRGRQAVREVYQYAMDQGMADAEIRTQEIYAVGDMICDIGRGTTLNAKGEVLGNVRAMTLWKKEEGKWRIHRDYTVPQ